MPANQEAHKTKDIELPLLTAPKVRPSQSNVDFLLEKLSSAKHSLSIPSVKSRKGIYYQLFACLCGVAMGAVRKIVPDVPVTQMLFVRTPFVLLLIILYFWKTQQLSEIKKGMNRKMFLMGSLSTISATFFFTAVVSLPLSDIMTIISTGAIMNGILASIFLDEPYLMVEKIVGGISFLGVIFIVRPPFLFGEASIPKEETETPLPRTVAAFFAFMAAASNSGSMTAMRSMKSEHHRFMIPFMINFVMLIVYSIYFTFFSEYTPLTFGDYFAIMIFAFLNLSAIYYTAMALETESSSTVGIVTHSQLIYSILIDLLAFGSFPSLLTLLGAGLVVGSCLYLLFVKK